LKVKYSFKYNSDEDACGAAFAGGPVALAYHKFSDQIKMKHILNTSIPLSHFSRKRLQRPGEFVVATDISENAVLTKSRTLALSTTAQRIVEDYNFPTSSISHR
jgi:hypothetical protein